MTFLEIARKVNSFVGLQGEIDSVTAGSSLQKVLIEFVNAAYYDIQLYREDWMWMFVDGQLPWGATSTQYSNSNINKYVKVYYNNADLIFKPYAEWITSSYNTTFPSVFTIVPESNAIIINPADASYVVDYRAYSNPETLSSNTQVPLLPARFHLAIVYKAVSEMGSYLGNPEIKNEFAWKYDIILGQLLRSQNAPKLIKQRPLV